MTEETTDLKGSYEKVGKFRGLKCVWKMKPCMEYVVVKWFVFSSVAVFFLWVFFQEHFTSTLSMPLSSQRTLPSQIDDVALLRGVHSKYTWSGMTPTQVQEAWKSELPEQQLISKFLPEGAIVLEIGGNIGRATVVACEKVGPKGRVVSAESFKGNRERILDVAKAFVEEGRLRVVPAISDKPLFQQGWWTNSARVTPSFLSTYKDMKDKNWVEIETISVSHVLALVQGLSVIIADCEGCFAALITERPDILQGVKMIIMENDGDQSRLASLRARLVKFGFSAAHALPQSICPSGTGEDGSKCFFSVLTRK